MKFQSDIDIDFADRSQVLAHIRHRAASIDHTTPHNTGIYVTEIPYDPVTNRATIDYRTAEERGYIKLDLLNVNIYNQVKSEHDLKQLMSELPPWQRLLDKSFCEQLIHIGNHYNTLLRMPETVNTILRLAMFLAIIRPGKRHLIGRTWAEVAATIWERTDDQYSFKRSHAVAYAHLVAVHMNLLNRSTNQGN